MRQQLKDFIEAIGKDAIAIIPAEHESLRSYDTEYKLKSIFHTVDYASAVTWQDVLDTTIRRRENARSVTDLSKVSRTLYLLAGLLVLGSSYRHAVNFLLALTDLPLLKYTGVHAEMSTLYAFRLASKLNRMT